MEGVGSFIFPCVQYVCMLLKPSSLHFTDHFSPRMTANQLRNSNFLRTHSSAYSTVHAATLHNGCCCVELVSDLSYNSSSSERVPRELDIPSSATARLHLFSRKSQVSRGPLLLCAPRPTTNFEKLKVQPDGQPPHGLPFLIFITGIETL